VSAQSVDQNYYTGEKSEYVHQMFSGIAHKYDLLNNVLSFSTHKVWRRRAVRLANLSVNDSALDVCTGTGDFAVDLFHVVGKNGMVVASDFCRPMVEHGRTKMQSHGDGAIQMMLADAQKLPYKDNQFDAITVGFGIRNVVDTQLAFNEMRRVAKPGGRVLCLEFNRPIGPLAPFVNFYQTQILPRIGAILSNDKAYKYLPESINAFHSRETLTQMMQAAGLVDIQVVNMNFGSVCLHIGTKPFALKRDGSN